MEIGFTTATHAEEQTFAQRIAASRQALPAYFARRTLNVSMLLVSDAIALSFSLLAAAVLRIHLVAGPADPTYLGWLWGIVPLAVVGSTLRGLYPGWGLGIVEELRRTSVLLLTVFALTAGLMFLTQQAQDTSRFVVAVSFLIALVAVPLLRTQGKRLLIGFGLWGAPTVIYGVGPAAREIINALHEEPGLGYTPIAAFDDDPDMWGDRIDGVPVLGGLDMVTAEAPVALLAAPSLSRERTIELLEGPLASYRTVVVIPDLAGAPSLWVRPRDVGGMLALEITSNLSSLPARLLKRAVDLVAVSITAPLWVPLCSMLAFGIWLEDRKSPFFRQERIGQNGRRFQALKFRTMVPNAEAVLQRYLQSNPEARAEWEAHYKLARDPRVTRIGRLLRRLSLDELPQLVNVLRGEMSLVGPRPLPRYHHDELSERVRTLRERVRPGLTGLWQVSGRSDIGNEGMERWDPYYVRNWSFWLDIVILVRTSRAVVQRSGAC